MPPRQPTHDDKYTQRFVRKRTTRDARLSSSLELLDNHPLIHRYYFLRVLNVPVLPFSLRIPWPNVPPFLHRLVHLEFLLMLFPLREAIELDETLAGLVWVPTSVGHTNTLPLDVAQSRDSY